MCKRSVRDHGMILQIVTDLAVYDDGYLLNEDINLNIPEAIYLLIELLRGIADGLEDRRQTT